MAITRLTPGGFPGASLGPQTHNFVTSITAATVTSSATLTNEQSPGTDDLISWWTLDESSGTRADSHGSNDLTDYNTVGSTTGKVSNAAEFVPANSEALYHADNASLSFGDEDFSITAWVYLDGKSGAYVIVGKWLSSSSLEYLLHYNNAVDRFRFLISGDGTSSTELRANNFGSPSTGTWYFVAAWHDADADEIGISVNNGTSDTGSYSSGCNDNSAEFNIGSDQDHTAHTWNGRLDEVGLWGKVLSDAEIEWLYNSGDGQTYSDLGETYNFTTSVTAATATNDSADLAVSRSFATSATAATATNDSTVLAASRLFTTAITAATATPSAELSILLPFATAITAATVTPDDAEINAARAFATSITAATATNDSAALSVLRTFATSITSATATGDAELLIVLNAVTAITATTATPDDAVITASMAMTVSATAATATSDSSVIAVSRTFATSATAATATPNDAVIIVAVEFTTAITAASNTSGTSALAVSRLFVTTMTAASNTTDVAIIAFLAIGVVSASFATRRPSMTFEPWS